MAKDAFGKEIATEAELTEAVELLRRAATQKDQMKINAITNLKLNALVNLSQTTARMVAKVHMKPEQYRQFNADLKAADKQLEDEINKIMEIGVQQ